MSKKTIAIDIDDVLAAGAEAFIAYSNERWGLRLTLDDYDEQWSEVWKTDFEETQRRALEWHHSGVVGKKRHYPDAGPVLRKLRAHYELVVVTSRRRVLLPETDAWLKQHFPGVFSAVHYAGIWDVAKKDNHTATKAELCREIGADYLIDDQLKHCFAAADAGINTILYGDYSWNRTDYLPDGVTRCVSWQDVEDFFAVEDTRQ